MAKRLDPFSKPFKDSRIPFLLAEVLTDGQGEMVDVVCRFANEAAAALLALPLEGLRGQRFTRLFPGAGLKTLEPLRDVAFSGSAASFLYTTSLDRRISVTCYQPRYGVAACILDAPQEGPVHSSALFPAEDLPGAVLSLELSRAGLRCLAFTQGLCDLTGWSRPELLDRCADLGSLASPEDRPELLQVLLDAVREDRRTTHSFRLLRRDQEPLWVEMQAEVLRRREGAASFRAVLLDAQQVHQTQARLEEAQVQLAELRSTLDFLFDGLSSSLCLYRRDTPEGPLRPLRVGRGMSHLLGYAGPQLEHHQAENPFWRVHPQDREALAAAAEEARAAGRPLHSVCRLRTRDSMTRWVALDAAWRRTEDGGELVYSTCSDITRERESSEEVRFWAQLSDLMLDQSRTMSFDYDPLEDEARSNRHDGAGRSIRDVSKRYFTAMDRDLSIHPEDRARRAAMIRRLLARPGAESLEYRANYDGQGWRWCRISWMSLTDGAGGVSRLLGRAEDVTMRKVNELRFQTLASRQRKLVPGVLISLQLDLSADRVTSARTVSRALTSTLLAGTADECLCRLRDWVPDEASRRALDETFRRQSLVDAFQSGEVHVELEHRLAPAEGGTLWVRTVAELAEDPETLSFTAFCTVTGIDARRQRDLLPDALAARDYDFVLTVDAASGACRVYGQEAVPGPLAYRTVAAQYLGRQTPSRKRSAFRQAVQLKTVLAHLETEAVYEYVGELEDGGTPRRKRMRWSWLDREAGLLLATLADVEPGPDAPG